MNSFDPREFQTFDYLDLSAAQQGLVRDRAMRRARELRSKTVAELGRGLIGRLKQALEALLAMGTAGDPTRNP